MVKCHSRVAAGNKKFRQTTLTKEKGSAKGNRNHCWGGGRRLHAPCIGTWALEYVCSKRAPANMSRPQTLTELQWSAPRRSPVPRNLEEVAENTSPGSEYPMVFEISGSKNHTLHGFWTRPETSDVGYLDPLGLRKLLLLQSAHKDQKT